MNELAAGLDHHVVDATSIRIAIGSFYSLSVKIEGGHDEIKKGPRKVLHNSFLQTILLNHLIPIFGMLLYKFHGVRLGRGVPTKPKAAGIDPSPPSHLSAQVTTSPSATLNVPPLPHLS